MVRPSEVSFDLRETSPLPRNIFLHIRGVKDHETTGQRMDPRLSRITKGRRGWLFSVTSPKVGKKIPGYFFPVRDTAKSGMGCRGNRHLNYLAESIFVNVGEPREDDKGSSLPMPAVEVGGVILLGARESRVHGEGRQEVDVSGVLISGIKPGGIVLGRTLTPLSV